MSVPEEENDAVTLNLLQSRRFACDRCHRQKLRCERSPAVVDGNVLIFLRPCGRCVRAGARCQTTSQTGSVASAAAAVASPADETTRNSRKGVGVKRKTTPADATMEEDVEPPLSRTKLSNSSVTTGLTRLPEISNPPNFDMDLEYDGTSYSDSAIIDMDTMSLIGQYEFDYAGGGADPDLRPETDTSVEQPFVPPGTDVSITPTSSLAGGPLQQDIQQDFLQGKQHTMDPVCRDSIRVKVAEVQFTGDSCLPSPLSPPATTSTPSTCVHFQQLTATNTVAPSDPSHTASRRLLELHSLLLTELHNITGADLVQAFFANESTDLQRSNAYTSERKNIMSSILFASERLIDFLVTFGRSGGPSTPPEAPVDTPSHFSCGGRSCSCGTHTTIHAHNPLSLSNTTLDDYFHPPTNPLPRSSVDGFPVIITFLSCYVSLLSVYRTIATEIYDTIKSMACDNNTITSPRSPFPRGPQSHLLPDPVDARRGSPVDGLGRTPYLSMTTEARAQDGFSRRGEFPQRHVQAATRPKGLMALLDSPRMTRQQVLGLRIQLEVMTDMLDQIQHAWRRAANDDEVDAAHQSSPLQAQEGELRRHHQSRCASTQAARLSPSLTSSATMELLRTMLAHENFALGDDVYGIGQGSVMTMLGETRKLLRTARFT